MKPDKPKLLVLGRGYLGQEFERCGHVVVGRDKFNFDPEHSEHLDALEQLVCLLDEHKPDAVVNCCGSANTRKCEDLGNWRETFINNTILPGVLSEWSRHLELTFVHISTGCFYDGQTGDNPATETAPLETHCHYTVSKLAGENSCDPTRDLIIRPRLLFSHDNHPANLLNKLRFFGKFLVAENSCTSTHTIVRAVESLVDAQQVGVFNVAENGHMSIWEMAEICGLTARSEKITAEELRQNQGLYLVNNVMDISKLREFYNPRDLDVVVAENWYRLYKTLELG